jgi:hypothetical protein
MNCDTVHDLLDLYLSGELKGDKMADVRLHLQQCEHCAMAVQADRELDNALRTAMLEETVDVSAVLDRFHERIAAPWWRRIPRLISVPRVAIAVILVIAVIVFPKLYVDQAQRNMALAAAGDHYEDLVLLRHSDWERESGDVTRFIQAKFPQKHNLLASITPAGASLEKVRLCKLRGTQYAHFVFRTGAVETSVYLLAKPEDGASYQASHLKDGGHGLEVAGFSSADMTGMVVGQHGSVPIAEIARQLAQTL